MDPQNQSSSGRNHHQWEDRDPLVVYRGSDESKIQELVEDLTLVERTWKATKIPATDEEAIDREQYKNMYNAAYHPEDYRYSSGLLRTLIHFCLFLQLGLMIGNWIWYGIEFQNSNVVTQGHKLLHGTLGRHPLDYFARNIFSYQVDNRSGTCRELGFTDMDNKTVGYPRYGIESMEAQSQFENTTMSHLNFIQDCDSVPGLDYRTGFAALGSCFVFGCTLYFLQLIEEAAREQDVRRCPSEGTFQHFVWFILFSKFWELGAIYFAITSSTKNMENLMKADIIQIFGKTVPSLAWDRTQTIGQCCGIHYYTFWQFNSSLDGYPKSCCNNLLFDCDSLLTITANEVWGTGCLYPEVANVIWGLVARMIFHLVDIVVKVCLVLLMKSYYDKLWDETKKLNRQRAKRMEGIVLNVFCTTTYELPPN